MKLGSTVVSGNGKLVLGVASFVVLLLVSVWLAVPAEAQQTDPLANATVSIDNTGGDPDVPNEIVITASNCDAEQGATPEIEIADNNGTPNENFIDGVGGIQINFEADRIIITSGGDDLAVGGTPARLTPGPGEVVSSSGITCGNGTNADGADSGGDENTGGTEADAASAGGVDLSCEQLIRLVEDGAAAGQYITEISQRCEGSANVIVGTVPGKSLADTGGPVPGLLVIGLLLAGAGLFLRASLRR